VTGRWPSVGVADGRAGLYRAPATPGLSPSEDTSTPAITGRMGPARAWARETSSRDMAVASVPVALPAAGPLGHP
jgi:hypothetical protein